MLLLLLFSTSLLLFYPTLGMLVAIAPGDHDSLPAKNAKALVKAQAIACRSRNSNFDGSGGLTPPT